MSDHAWEVKEQRRARDIMLIAKDRKIDVLCHFTRLENLSGILRNGLLSRTSLEKSGASFVPTDMTRQEGYPEAVCLSVSFPTYKMLYRKRVMFRQCNQVTDSQWIVLLLDAKLLWELECGFCQQNAATYSERRVSRKDMRTPQALESDVF